MITTKYTARAPRPGKRYVRTISPGKEYAWCVRDRVDPRYDCQQGFCDAADLTDAVRRAADARYGFSPSYVEWPE